jgi:Domain of unknown function DUF11
MVIALACLGAIVLLSGAVGSAASPNEVCATSGPLVCVDIVGDPATVPPSEAGSPPHFVSYSATVANDGPQAATHVTADLDLSGGLVLVSATPSVGSCSVDLEPTCTLGRLAGGATATIDFVARVPETTGPATARLTASFDETVNDGPTPDPKQDSVFSTEHTSVALPDGAASTFVPEGASASLTTDPTGAGVATPTDPLIGGAVITTSPTSVVASIEEVAVSLSCPKKVICPSGDWFHADIPGTFDPPLAFPLRWDGTLFSGTVNAKKFALVYTACLDGCKLEIISNRCSSATPAASELPCLSGVAKLADGDVAATLISDHNGYMK